MAVFKILHMNHEHMRLFKDSNRLGCTRVHTVYRELISNRQLESAKSAVAIKNAWQRKIHAAYALLNSKYYDHVATVETSNIMSAIKLTQSIDGPWYLHKNPLINVHYENLPYRSTHRHDVIISNDDSHYMYSGIKVLNMSSLEII